MSYHITSETKRRLALGLSPQLPKNRNRRRRIPREAISFTGWDMAIFGTVLWIIGFLSAWIHFSP